MGPWDARFGRCIRTDPARLALYSKEPTFTEQPMDRITLYHNPG